MPGCAVTFELYRFLETNDIDIDELSSAAMIRLDTMDLDLLNMGYPKNKTGAAIQLEWYIRDLIKKWKREGIETGQLSTMAEWALRQMTTSDFTNLQVAGINGTPVKSRSPDSGEPAPARSTETGPQ